MLSQDVVEQRQPFYSMNILQDSSQVHETLNSILNLSIIQLTNVAIRCFVSKISMKFYELKEQSSEAKHQK